ncbi:hypothetical protein VCR14J2_380101 [Vibrio coralliirubri]|nr:hypothetical protein VCR14J2_380101 [Vibrio coralliirubri]
MQWGKHVYRDDLYICATRRGVSFFYFERSDARIHQPLNIAVDLRDSGVNGTKLSRPR